MKRILSIALAVLMVLSVCPVFALEFTDVAKDNPSYEAIYKLVNAGILEGDGNGLFRPFDGLTRGEFCKIINKIFGYTEEATDNFKDVTTNDWYYKEVKIARKAGYIAGYGDDTFRGDNMLTREQTCTIISRVAKLYDLPIDIVVKDFVSSWHKADVQKIIANKLMSLEANGTFRATENITRAEMAAVSAHFVKVEEPEEEPEEDEGSSLAPSGSGSGSTSTTPNYKKLNKKMISSLNSVLGSFAKIEFTDAEKSIIAVIESGVNSALDESDEVELTNEYLREKYIGLVKETQAMMNALGEDAKGDFQVKVLRKVDDEAYDFLMDFFFPIEG